MCALIAFALKCQRKGFDVTIYVKDQKCNVALKTNELTHHTMCLRALSTYDLGLKLPKNE